MDIIRWIITGLGLAYYSTCLVLLTSLAFKRVRTGVGSSGLAFFGSFVAALAIVLMPLGSLGQRLPYVVLPFAVEGLYFAFNLVMDRARPRNTVDSDS